jgi:two-component system nitrogen regulation sensor histidine kinase NtrY
MEKTNNKGIRIIIAGIALFFVFFVVIKIFFDESKKLTPALPSSTTMFIALWVIIILFSLTFLYILLRNIIKLYYDRGKDTTGGRVKNRLVFFFIAFSIVPTLLLFFFATDLINNGIDKWFKPEIDQVINKVGDLKNSYYEKAKDDLKYISRVIVDAPKGIKGMRMYTDDNRVYLSNYVKQQMKNYRLDVVNVYRNRKEILSQFKPDTDRSVKEGGADPQRNHL